MPAGGLLALLDDMTAILDDVAAMSKIAAKKTAGITGDDLAVNAEVLRGIDPKRELPIIWAVAKGSLKNKAFLVPGALALNAFAPWSIVPLLMFGGLFLCFEGAEKILHARKAKNEQKTVVEAARKSAEDLMAVEKDKIKKAIQTDLILSAEIIAIALATVADKPLLTEALVLTCIAIGITVVVYGLVGLIVKLDDIGLYLAQRKAMMTRKLGHGLLVFVPHLMRVLSVVGTAAMFAVGGGILVHGTPLLTALLPQAGWQKVLGDAGTGLIAGFLAVAAWHVCEKPIKDLMKKITKK